jgi:hypothetical protein
MEFMAQVKAKIVYMKGKDNTIADALSLTAFEHNSDAEL